MKIVFLPNKTEYKFEQGKSVLELASFAAEPIDGNCSGAGSCGKCKVKVISGNDSSLDHEEKAKLTNKEIDNGYRLACRFYPSADVVIEIPEVQGTVNRKTKLIHMPENFIMGNGFREELIDVEQTTIKDQINDLEKIKKACGICSDTVKISAQLLKKIPLLLRDGRTLTITLRVDEIVNIQSGDARGTCYGLAFDIGTTTVVGHLWNLISGEFVDIAAASNPQGLFGADVISRITYADENCENLNNIHKKIIDCINEIAFHLISKYDIKQEDIYDIAVVGNTTMSHLFLGVNPKQLAISPFAPVFCDSISDFASNLLINSNENAKFYLLPNIAGHVGSDITAGILSTGLIKTDGINLLLDVGTNGEIVLCGNGQWLTCSTAAGPAFEGASIYQGMRAADGAIERVKISDDVHIEVIGNGKPIGICGSGIIDAVAQLIANGLIDKTGKFVNTDLLLKNGVNSSIVDRFRKGSSGNEFVLAYNDDSEDIVILQKDIREVQLAKAAIYAGIKIMMDKLSIAKEEINAIKIAGAFGNYIDIDSALTIGLLPKIDREKIESVGNSAGIGACMALMSLDSRNEAELIAKTIKHVELAVSNDFQNEYIKAMKF